MTELLTPDGARRRRCARSARERYHNRHPFHRLLHDGECSEAQVQAWALNRYYYQAMIPLKDAGPHRALRDPAVRRDWRKRLEDHDGDGEGEGGIERWLQLTDGLGLDRDYVDLARRHPARRPGSRSRPMCISCASGRLLEAIASSLTELFSPQIISERVAGMLAHYDYITPGNAGLFRQAAAAGAARRRFRARLRQASTRARRSSSGGARRADVQVRRAVDAARRAVSRLCRRRA